jgi:hypothetical protein
VSRQGKTAGRLHSAYAETCNLPAVCSRPVRWDELSYDSMFLLATMPLARIAAVIGMWSAALVSLAW